MVIDKEVIRKAAKYHGAYDIPSIVEIVDSFGELRSEAAVFELVRLLKLDKEEYGSLFYTRKPKSPVITIDEVEDDWDDCDYLVTLKHKSDKFLTLLVPKLDDVRFEDLWGSGDDVYGLNLATNGHHFDFSSPPSDEEWD